MNPWALLVILLGIVLIIVGIKGTQHNFTSAITGHSVPGSGATTSPATGQSGKKTPPTVVNPGNPIS
jgi:hypothetical protein